MTEENSYPVPIEKLEPIAEGPFKGLNWATPSLPHIRRAMRSVVADPLEAARRGERARQLMVEKYCPDCLASIVERHIKELWLAKRAQATDAGKKEEKDEL